MTFVIRPREMLIDVSGHLQTMYCVVGNFTKVDKVEYKR